MDDLNTSVTMEDMEADFQRLGLNSTKVLRQLAQLDKNLLRETLHEAGHCLAAWHLGFPVQEMDICEYESSKRGYKSVKFEISRTRLDHKPDGTYLSLAVVCLAGMAAEQVLFSESYKKTAWKSDIDTARDYLKKLSSGEKRTVLFQRAMDIAQDIVRENWSRIERLTIGAYHSGPVLDGVQVLELITGES